MLRMKNILSGPNLPNFLGRFMFLITHQFLFLISILFMMEVMVFIPVLSLLSEKTKRDISTLSRVVVG